jgi:hypothetical protein
LLLGFVPLHIDICILNHHVISHLLLFLLLSHFKGSLFPLDEVSPVLRCYLLSLSAVGSVCCDELILVDVEWLVTGRRLISSHLWILAIFLIVFIIEIVNEVAIIVHVVILVDSFDLIFVLALSLFLFVFITFLNTSDI